MNPPTAARPHRKSFVTPRTVTSVRWVLALCVVSLLVSGCTSPAQVADPFADAPPAPAFTVDDLDGDPVSLSDFHGKAVVLNLWATWCESCKQEMPAMQQLHDEWNDRGLAMIAVSLDEASNKAAVDAFVAEHGLDFTLLFDPDGEQMTPKYRNIGLPYTYLIDPQGRLVDSWMGAWEPLALEYRDRIERAMPI